MNRYAYSHFCDDIRIETGYKTSLMGIYGGEMFVPQFPIVLPKFGVVVFCATPAERPFQALTIKVSTKESPLQEFSFGAEDLAMKHQEIIAKNASSDPVEFISFGAHVLLTPLVLDRETTISVVVIADGEELKAGKLRIKLQDPSPDPTLL